MRSAPRVGGTFRIQVFIQPSSPETRCESFLVVMAAVVAEWGGLFLATSLKKIIGGVMESSRSGWM